LLDAGAAVAIASNCNPGTSYTSAMSFCVTTAVLQMHLTLAEAIRAATRGGALALRPTDVGPLGCGARPDLHVPDAPAAVHLAYRPGMPLTHQVWRAGRRLARPGCAPLPRRAAPAPAAPRPVLRRHPSPRPPTVTLTRSRPTAGAVLAVAPHPARLAPAP